MDVRNRRTEWVLIGGMALFAAILRVAYLGRESLWYDEAFSYLAATLSPAQIWSNAIQSSHPPLYYFLLHLWLRLVPDQDAALRLLGTVWNLALIPTAYGLSRALLEQGRLALTAAFLVAVSPFHILYSQELRMYTQVMLLALLGVWGYWQGRRTGGWRWWWLCGGAFLLALYTHYFAIWPLLAVGLHALLRIRDRQAWWRAVLTLGVVGVLFLPWVGVVLRGVDPELGALRPLTQTYALDPLKPLTTLAFLIFGISNQLWYTGLALFAVVAVTAVLLLEGRRIRAEGLPDGLLLVFLIIGLSLGAPLLMYFIRPFFLTERTMAVASPFLMIVLAWGVSRRQSPLPYLVGLVVVGMLAGVIMHWFQPDLKPPYREVMTWVAQQRQPGDAVLHTSDGSYWPALRYVDWPDHVVLAGDPDPRRSVAMHRLVRGDVWSREEVIARGNRLWLIVALEHSVEWQLEQADFFARQFTLLQRHEIGGIQIYLYDVTAVITEE